MIIAYFLIAAFAMGWEFGGSYNSKNQTPRTIWGYAATILLLLAWPFLAFVLFKMWREGKL